MTTQLKSGGRKSGRRVSVLLAVACALLASLFAPVEQASATTLPRDPAIATLSVPDTCVDPEWASMTPSMPDATYIVADGGQTTMAYVFEPGHHYFRADCADSETRYKFGVTGPTSSLADLDEEMRWTHRYVKRVERTEIIFHPPFIADGLPGPGYVDTVSWEDWKVNVEAAEAQFGIDVAGLELALLDRLVARDRVGTAALVIEGNHAWVQVSHIGS